MMSAETSTRGEIIAFLLFCSNTVHTILPPFHGRAREVSGSGRDGTLGQGASQSNSGTAFTRSSS